ncbi:MULTISPECIES: SDR family oxidoreductase [Sphingobacterium]|uniref:SDR family oxidoreductase n=1 Tax=Sphingobacterium TaxID=28453 RepID=UPI0013D9DE1C|nr:MULTISPECIES: SDR family oxidoreductase [unclassified Sphingobacterium]
MIKGFKIQDRRFPLQVGAGSDAIHKDPIYSYAVTTLVDALTKSMAIDYAKDGIRVNTVLSAAVMTPTLKQWISEQENSRNMNQFLEDIHLLGYCPEGGVIADACVFLISDKAHFITGVSLPVSGGAELGYRRNV